MSVRPLALLCAALLTLPAAAFADTTPTDTAPAAPATAPAEDEAARIDRLKAEGAALRAEAEATYQATEPGCYERFLVNRCIDDAKHQRLETIKRARALEAEARRLELAARQRAAAAETRTTTDAPLNPASPSPAGDAQIVPPPEAERLRADREAASERAEAAARAERAAQDAERARARRAAEAEAAARAEQAARDRARYEERIREFEEKKARDASGR